MKILTWLLYFFIRLISITYRIKFHPDVDKYLEKTLKNGRFYYVFALWHQNIIGAVFSHMKRKHGILVSPSKDGEYVAVVCEKLGHYPFRGSSRNRGRKGLQELIEQMQKKTISACITVDGPTGPKHEVKIGAVEIARQTQTPLIALCPIAKKYWSFNSWDQFRLPKPFSEIMVVYGPPRFVKDKNNKEICHLLKQDLQTGEKTAKKYLDN